MLARRIARLAAALLPIATAALATLPHPLLFVTQVPIPYDASKIKFQPNPVTATFANHLPETAMSGRGGDLYLLQPGPPVTLVNLTGAAGYGVAAGFQGATSIAVRDPCVSFDAGKALFSMVIGAPTVIGQNVATYWQIYELANLDQVVASNAIPIIGLVPNQPAGRNNVSPCYASDGRIFFTSDHPPRGAAQLAPQFDEYVAQPTNSGLWSFDPTIPGGDLTLLDASPSGDFSPSLDSFGRVVLTRWDHLQRDVLADQDFALPANPPNGAFNWTAEPAGALAVADTTESFPAPQSGRPDQALPGENPFEFNVFFPWMIDQDGSAMETVNHIGRHELLPIVGPSFNNDSNLVLTNYVANPGSRTNPNWIVSAFGLREMPTAPGTYVAVDGPEVGTQGAGQIITLPAPPGANPDDIVVGWKTSPATKSVPQGATPACHSGYYRNPIALSDSSIIAAHAGESSPGQPETRATANDGTRANPVARYKFRLVDLVDAPGCAPYKKYSGFLTGGGVTKTLSYFDPTVLVRYSNVQMWELQPVEVVARAVPPMPTGSLPAIESAVFASAGVDPAIFEQFLLDRDLALIVARDVTTRDQADRQQPWQLQVQQPGGVQTPPAGSTTGIVYPVKYLQIFQGDLVRGYGGAAAPLPGRRALARPAHEGGPHPPPADGTSPPGAVEVEADGSFAALVPAHRAVTWQLVDDAGAAKVRERFWLSFAAGEMRVCTSCHGINTADQAGDPPPTSSPLALAKLLAYWKTWVFSDDFGGGDTARWSAVLP